MKAYTLPYFGSIDSENLEEYYEAAVELNGKLVRIDLNIEEKSLNKQTLDQLNHFLENITKFDLKNYDYIQQDFKNEKNGTVREYVDFHIEELGKEFLKQLNITPQTDLADQFLAKLYLKRIGLYPDGKYETTYFAAFDYTVHQQLTDQLIVVKTDHQGHLDHLSWES